MDRLTVALALVLGTLVSCVPDDQARYSAWDTEFSARPAAFAQAVTALWIAEYRETPGSGRFYRASSWGQVPEKLVPDGHGGWSVAVPLLVQAEDSDGPRSDQFVTALVRVLKTDDRFVLEPNSLLPGMVEGWHDAAQRTVRFRGLDRGPGADRTLWQFQGRY